MFTLTLDEGVERLVHVYAKNLKDNMKNGTDLPVIAVRDARTPEEFTLYRHVEILGPSTLKHTPEEPVPGTGGRAVCVLRTSAALLVTCDVPSETEAGQPALR